MTTATLTEGERRVHAAAPCGCAAGEEACDAVDCTCEQIQLRAYEIFQMRQSKGEPGDAQSDWLQAEHELKTGDRGAA